jgi:hypothetical protein
MSYQVNLVPSPSEMKNENIHEIMVHDGNDQGLTTILENLAKTIVHHVMSAKPKLNRN